MNELLKYKIGITLIPGIGDVLAKNLISYCGSIEGVFKEKKAKLQKIPGIGLVLADAIRNHNVLERAEQEIRFIEKYKIAPLFYLDDDYPQRLKHCHDSPVMLYYKGKADLNTKRVVGVVGTRNATLYGKKICQDLVSGLADHDVLIVSGLAYGVDICAHKAALTNDLPTIGVLAHGLDKIYPAAHRSTAEKMLAKGGLLTEFLSQTQPDRENFPKRNRIVAGMADATIVIESKDEGGSLITADIANSYNRDVFAFPGKVDDEYSVGCNQLIKNNKAALIESAADVLRLMGWEKQKQKKKTVQQRSLFHNLSPEEEAVVAILREKPVGIDELCLTAKLNMSKVSMLLLNLELTGVVRSLPGKVYSLN
ncbi:MAG: DNA-protecting protein DprA [Bacteroidetes bacterium]|nr:DNA-protecting protein DprA [Bacteroidota bacterium]